LAVSSQANSKRQNSRHKSLVFSPIAPPMPKTCWLALFVALAQSALL
jgi:hypothetical protein